MFTSSKKFPLGVHALALSIATILISGCSAPLPKCCGDSPALQAAKEKAKDNRVTDNKVAKLVKTKAEFHDAALNPDLYTTRYPLYILGIEKPRANSATPYPLTPSATPRFDITRLKLNADDQGAIKAVLDDPRAMILTHILSIRPDTKSNDTKQKECFIYNIYKDAKSAPWCQYKQINKVEEDKENWTQEGWKALDLLGDEIKKAAKDEKATHIIVLATGWNTEQYESYWDFKAWMEQLAGDFKDKGIQFRPIFIGISWESEWGILPKFFSFTTKGNDADVIGFTWANYLLNDILKPIVASTNSHVQLVAIGHSFGSRIVLGSHYVRDILDREKHNYDSLPVTLIGLEAAFPTGRFNPTKGKEHPYNAKYKDNATVVITSSTDDKANKTISFGTGYIGGEGGIEELDENKQTYESVIVFNTDKEGKPDQDPDKNKVSVYNATPFVNCELPGTESGAHSDVYDKEMGHFLGEIIRKSK